MGKTNKTTFNRKELEHYFKRYHTNLKNDLSTITSEVERLFINESVKPTIKSRVKSFDSVYMKILKQPIEGLKENPFSSLHDIFGVRIICKFIEDVHHSEDLIQRHFTIIDREIKGVESPHDLLGYKSTHLLIAIPANLKSQNLCETCEIQIRTILQEAWSEVEHELVYKSEFKPYDEPLKLKLAALNANLTLADIIFQEIRDYQSQLQKQLNIRRDTFLQKVATDSKLMINCCSYTNRKSNGNHSKSIYSSFSNNGSEKNIDTLLLRGLIAHNCKQYSKAKEIYTQILSLDLQPSIRAIILIHRGMAYFEESKYDKSMDDFCQAIKIDPSNARARYNRGIIYMCLKEYKNALMDFDKSISIGPDFFEYYFYRAQVNYILGFRSEAIQDFREALNLNPDATEILEFIKMISS
ncbi:MAG: tetratricopeptide repeat protein [Candidatus Latescibacteria bacterium]|nr:tetratricopeptide repeat protein [Candidatus Latescibacterota bacterium]